MATFKVKTIPERVAELKAAARRSPRNSERPRSVRSRAVALRQPARRTCQGWRWKPCGLTKKAAPRATGRPSNKPHGDQASSSVTDRRARPSGHAVPTLGAAGVRRSFRHARRLRSLRPTCSRWLAPARWPTARASACTTETTTYWGACTGMNLGVPSARGSSALLVGRRRERPAVPVAARPVRRGRSLRCAPTSSAHGIRVPVDVDELGQILDGHHAGSIAASSNPLAPQGYGRLTEETSGPTPSGQRPPTCSVRASAGNSCAPNWSRDPSRSDRAIGRLCGSTARRSRHAGAEFRTRTVRGRTVHPGTDCRAP